MDREKHFPRDRHFGVAPTAMWVAAAVLAGVQGSAAVADHPLALPVINPPSDPTLIPTVQAISDGRTGCTQHIVASADGQLPAQCGFDSSAFGTRLDIHVDTDAAALDTHVVAAGTIDGMWTADQLIGTRQQRFADRGSLVGIGLASSLLDDRLTVSIESNWSQNRSVSRQGSTGPFEMSENQGQANSVKLDFKLIDSPQVKWSVSGNYSSISSGYSTGRSFALMRYFALPGTRANLSSKLRVGDVGITALLDHYGTSFGETNTRRISVDVHGITLTFSNRGTSTVVDQQLSLLQSQIESKGLYADFDMNTVRDELLPQLEKLGALMPVSLSVYLQSARSRMETSGVAQAFSRSSFETSASWETPLGNTDLDYMSQRRIGVIGLADRTDDYLQISHSFRWGSWRFGVDGMLSTGSSGGIRGSRDRTLSLGGSLAYYLADGPQLRLQIGQDQTASRLNDDSFVSNEHYSNITGSLDLSRYLQRQFDRDDLHLTLDYRRALDRDESTISMFDDAIERLIDGYTRSGFLFSFGMNL
ncbi:MAG TPA: hypothetical protein VFK19_01730 [Sphingomicrobium sp.]|nr:hypothetical protein [Sphingomicrobium sp.]